MDYNQGDHRPETRTEIDAPHWEQWSHGPRSDSMIYERVNSFEHSQPHMSTESRYGLDPYGHGTMTWPQQAPGHMQTPSLHLSQEAEHDLDILDQNCTYSNLASPSFDQASFLSVSPQHTPGEGPHLASSYFQAGPSSGLASSAGSDEPSQTPTPARKKERAQHNIVEHRYREKLNGQINLLKDKVPALREGVSKKGVREPPKIGKSMVLVKAGEYIDHLESENARLKKRMASLERLVQKLTHDQS